MFTPLGVVWGVGVAAQRSLTPFAFPDGEQRGVVGVDPFRLRWTRRVGSAVPDGVGSEVLAAERGPLARA
jgi:hypothetical protein